MILLYLLIGLLSFLEYVLMISVSTDISNFMKAEVTGSYFRESNEYLHSSINSKRQSCKNVFLWMCFFRNVYKIKWRLTDDENFSLTRIFTSNILLFTQISINAIIGGRGFQSEMYRNDSIAWRVQKEKNNKGLREKEDPFFKGDALFIFPTVKDACITFLWFKNQCSSENRSVFYHVPSQLVKLILYGISSNKNK